MSKLQKTKICVNFDCILTAYTFHCAQHAMFIPFVIHLTLTKTHIFYKEKK